MPTYFLDSSALVKRQIAEVGHSWVRALCDPAVGNTLVIAELALVEVPATYCRMARETPKRISTGRRDRLLANFDMHVQHQYAVVRVTLGILTHAATLCRTHLLRAYDAVQLASALARRQDDLAIGQPVPTFVCADAVLLSSAAAEGLAIENPNNYP